MTSPKTPAPASTMSGTVAAKPDGYITVHRVKGSTHKGNWICRSRLQSAEEAKLHREQLDALFTSHCDTFETVSLPVYIDHLAATTEGSADGN